MAEVTYADLKFMTLEPRNPEPHESKAKESPTPSPYWRLATVILGIFCLGLLVTAGILSVKFTQVYHLVNEWHGNLTQKIEFLANLTQQLEFLQAQNLNLSETVQELANYKGHRCSPCPENWLQHGENCYFFSTKWKTWQESKALCSSLASRFLKIESKEKLGFILRSAQYYSSYSFWIALSFKGANKSWLWEDGTAFSTDLFRIPEASYSLYPICVSIQGANVNTAECESYKFCICEKMANPPGTV